MENKLILTQDGSHTLLSEKFGVHYHSIFGAVNESEHVFLKEGLFQFSHKAAISILETGFGTGLNAWLTRQKTINQAVSYTAFETNPISAELEEKLNYATTDDTGNFLKLHTCQWNEPVKIATHFTLLKLNHPVQEYPLPHGIDLIYHDAFAPDIQPELWDISLFQKYYDCLNEGGILVTYCAKGEVKRALRECGFKVERLQGPPRKRHMLRAIKPIA
ncbi:MAG: tRNA (5-methylaminomethyl-2-thiouridine)(34)-methyltransferase MnmD [Bacteroidia bacterium]|nr:tRNA (5-methylaminomethyl-2-thiouridine)(34)-methyltransferase MnmD [Bacteroidia bacterium]